MSRAIVGQDEHPWAESISGLIAAHAAHAPDAAAILAPGRPALSYAGLRQQVESVVAALNGAGIGRGDRVAIVLPNGPEMAVAFLSVASGATCAPLNPGYRAPEFEFYLTDLGAKALLTLAGMESPAREVAAARGIPIIELTPGEQAGAFDLSGGGAATDRSGAATGSDGGFGGPDDVALVLHTSGTTARPKLVPLTHTNLCSSAAFLREALALTPADRCLNVMPLFHIHGLICAILATIEARASVTCTPGFEAPRFFEWMDECRPTWYTAVPTMHQAIVARSDANRDVIDRSPLRIVRSASASLPPTVMAELEGALGVPVVESYAMTEAATSITCNPLPPGERKPGSVGLPRGPEVAVMDEAGNLLPQGQVGEIVLRGPNVTGGYDGNPEANATAFVDGWFRTGDQGVIDEDGYLAITGRIKEIINRAGEKVSPREVDEALLGHPAVAQAVAFAMPDPRLGEDVAAAVVLREGAEASERDLQEHTARLLADFKVPRRIVFLDEVPKGPTGKLQRIGLAEKLGLTADAEPAPAAEFVEPATETEKALASLWCEVLGLERVGTGDNFFYLGGDSVLAVRLFTQLDRVFGRKLPLATLLGSPTVGGLAKVLQEDGWSGAWKPIIPMRTTGSRQPFFCVAVMDAFAYVHLARYLDEDQPFYVLHPLGLLSLDDPDINVQELATQYVEEVRAVQPKGPYFLGGMCSGGTIAYEMSQQLMSQGQEVALLAMIDAPLPGGGKLRKVTHLVQRCFHHFRALWRQERGTRLDYIRARLRTLKRRLLGAGGAAGDEAGFEAYWAPIHRAYRRALPRYVPEPYAGRVAMFLGTETPMGPPFDPRLAWRSLLKGTEVHVVPGDHTSMLRDPNVGVLAEKLSEALASVVPANETGKALALLWCEILGLERVGTGDNFFHLGGDSILAMRLISRVREAWGTELSILSLFAEGSTIAGQTELIEDAKARKVAALPGLERGDAIGQAPLSYPQEGQWLLHQLDPSGLGLNRIVALRLRGELNVPAVRGALNEVVRRHEALRTSFRATEDGPVQLVHDAQDVPLPVEDLSDLGPEAEAAATRFARERMAEPFDLAAAPPLRAWLLRLGEDDHILALVTHHIVCDGRKSPPYRAVTWAGFSPDSRQLVYLAQQDFRRRVIVCDGVPGQAHGRIYIPKDAMATEDRFRYVAVDNDQAVLVEFIWPKETDEHFGLKAADK